MRNLKRVLSLALASVMLLGMMAIGAGAADSTTYSDQSAITKEEAVAVMSAIGVFQGSDGKFNPTGDLTRETAAKIITYMLMGKDAADALVTSGAPFTDVAAGRWSAGSIAYCVQNGIVSGDGQGHFFPEMTINGASFAKMLLVALGYNANTEKLVGTGWEINVAKLAKSAKLLSGLSNSSLSKTMNREQAAQMAFNTLKGDLVQYTGGSSIDLGNGTNIVIGGTREKTGDTFAEYYYDSLTSSDGKTDDFGRPATVWKNGVKTIGTFATSADYIYTAKTDADDIDDEIGDYLTKEVTAIVKATLDPSQSLKVSDADTLADITGNGRSVEVYTKNDQVDKVVVIDTYMTTINTVNTVSKTVTLASFKGNTVDVVKKSDNSSLYTTLADMGKDAKVLVVLSGSKVLSAATPEEVTGTYSGRTSGNVRTVGGEKYEDSLNADVSALTKYNTTYTVYLDTYGYLIGAELESASESSYAYLISAEKVGSGSAGFSYNAKLLFTDGTQSWVEVASLNDTKVGDFEETDDTNWGKMGAAFVTYTVKSDGTYALNSKAVKAGGVIADAETQETDYSYTFSNATITKNAAYIFGSANANIQGSSKTIFVVKASSGYTVYTGVKNVPNLENATGTVLVGDGALTADVVVITKKDNAADSSDLVYIIGATTGDYYNSTFDGTLYTYDAIVDGKSKTNPPLESSIGTLTAGMYTASYDSNGFVIKATKAVASDILKVATKATVSNGTITATGSGVYVTADDFKTLVVDVDAKDKVAEISPSEAKYYDQSAAYVIMDDDGEFAVTLIIIKA